MLTNNIWPIKDRCNPIGGVNIISCHNYIQQNKMGAFDLYDQVGFYAEYHHNPVNKWIHIICVPMILFTAQVWLTYTGPLTSALSFLPVPANLAFFITIFYVFYYIVLEPVAGVS